MGEGRSVDWDEIVEVVVVGSGFAGMAAAREAAANVESVVVLEKMSYVGGNSRIAGGGYCCWDSRLKLREELGLGEDSWELHCEDTLRAGGGYASPKLAETLAKEAPAGLDLMVDAGIPFRKTLPRIGGHSAYRSYQIACTGAETMAKLKDYCIEAPGVDLRCNSKVCEVVRERDGAGAGRVTGVVVEGPNGRYRLGANRGVIVASGGFANDIELRTAHKPTLGEAYSCTNHRGATGEMIRQVAAVGADTVHMEFIQLYPCADPKTGGIDQGAFLCYSGTGYGLVYVSSAGARFVNELASREVVSDAQISLGSRPTYSILNDEIFSKLGIGWEDVGKLVSRGRAFRAGSLAELAVLAGFDPELFEASISRHNGAIESGVDEAFGKPITDQMIPLLKGDFYAIPQWPSVHFCMGGLRIDDAAHVLDVWGEPIPGLYAAGEVCGGLHGSDRLGGNAIAECFVFGRIAGRLN